MKKVSGWKTKKDWKVSCQPTMKRHFGYWRRTMRSLREKCLGGIPNSRRETEKENQQATRAVTNEVASNPFEKVALAGRPIWPMNIRIPTTRHIGEKARKIKFQYPYDGNKGYPSYDNGKGKGGQEKGKSKTFEKTEEPPFSRLHHPQSLPMPVGQIKIGIHPGIGVNKASTGQAQQNPTYAILDNGCTRSMGSWHAIQRFTQAIEPMKDLISYSYIPAETKFSSLLEMERQPR